MKWTNEAIIQAIQENTCRGVVAWKDKRLKSTVKCMAIKRFGSWLDACAAADVQPGKRTRDNYQPVREHASAETIQRGLKVLERWGIDYEAARG